jgi:hypothetical protein
MWRDISYITWKGLKVKISLTKDRNYSENDVVWIGDNYNLVFMPRRFIKTKCLCS